MVVWGRGTSVNVCVILDIGITGLATPVKYMFDARHDHVININGRNSESGIKSYTGRSLAPGNAFAIEESFE